MKVQVVENVGKMGKTKTIVLIHREGTTQVFKGNEAEELVEQFEQGAFDENLFQESHPLDFGMLNITEGLATTFMKSEHVKTPLMDKMFGKQL